MQGKGRETAKKLAQGAENVPTTSLIVVANWENGNNSQQEQQLFCHFECLKKRLSKNAPLYIADLVE